MSRRPSSSRRGLGVEACFDQPTWTEVTAGGWSDRLDIAYGSGAINATRMEHLYMTQPYYYVPQRFVVPTGSAFQKPSDLDGKKIGTCTSCTVESYLKKTLVIPGVDLVQKVKDPQARRLRDRGSRARRACRRHDRRVPDGGAGRRRGDQGGQAVPAPDETAFSMYPSGFVDKRSGLEVKAFVDRVDEIIRAAHADGTLKALSTKWFGTDYTTVAGHSTSARSARQSSEERSRERRVVSFEV